MATIASAILVGELIEVACGCQIAKRRSVGSPPVHNPSPRVPPTILQLAHPLRDNDPLTGADPEDGTEPRGYPSHLPDFETGIAKATPVIKSDKAFGRAHLL
jgi:hypothetical protein